MKRTSIPTRRSRFRRRMTSKCDEYHHQPLKARRTIDMTSYAEVVLARLPLTLRIRLSAISSFRPRSSGSSRRSYATRRPRSVDEQTLWMFHLMAVHGAEAGEMSYETDRMRFIGRGRTLVAPACDE